VCHHYEIIRQINFILLAGIFSYNSQKIQIRSSLSDKIKYELKYISEDLNEAIHELDLLSKIFLSSPSMQVYLNEVRSDSDSHYLNKGLTKKIRQLEFRHGYVTSFGLIDSDKQELFLYDILNPFSSIEYSNSLNSHLSYINKSIQTQGVTEIKPTRYEYRNTTDGFNELVLIRTFSPDQPISTLSFSQGHSTYTAIITIRLKHKGKYLSSLQTVFGEEVKLSSSSTGSSNIMKGDSELTMLPEPKYGYRFSNELWSIIISLPNSYLTSLYQPYKLLFIAIVLAVTFISFFFLKGLIVNRIISPVVRLTKQVESTEIGEHINIERSQTNDEVSILTNKYLDLIIELDEMAKYDHLTGLVNRAQFNKILKRVVEYSTENNQKTAVFYLDLDNFKCVNDRFGHYIGDQLLKEFAVRVENYLTDRSKVYGVSNDIEFARISGDEFALILPNIVSIDDVEQVAKNIIHLFDAGFKLQNNVFDIGVSIGISIFPDDANDVTSVLKKADVAMYSAKNTAIAIFSFIHPNYAVKSNYMTKLLLA